MTDPQESPREPAVIQWEWQIADESGEAPTNAEAMRAAKAAARRAYRAGAFNPRADAGVLWLRTERGPSLVAQLIYEPGAVSRFRRWIGARVARLELSRRVLP